MSVDSLQTGISTQAIQPKQDANGQSQREQQRKGNSGKSQHDRQDAPDPAPVLNSQGQVTGRTINIAV
ncbi:MAG: hypothetical protein HZC24_14495 [Rhodocyclales bacterium]|nr:hypothetical protein [Rhodocyclales bacterium]